MKNNAEKERIRSKRKIIIAKKTEKEKKRERTGITLVLEDENG